jgi:hypothetical protein
MYRLRFFLVILILGILISESCKNLLINDLSLTPEEYQKLGMPDHKNVWRFDDYFKSNITLGSIKINNHLTFPRKESKKSGVVFSRFVNKENLAFVNDTTLPLHSRAYLIQQFARYPGQLYQLYADSSKKKQYYHHELIDIDIFILFVNEQKLMLAFQIMNSNDEADISLQYGLKTVKYNYLKIIERLLAEQVKSKVFTIKDLNRLSTEVSRSLQENNKWFLPADRITIGSEILAVIEKSPSHYCKNNYNKILKILNESDN